MITLYTTASPNGYKATIALEELGLPYRLHHVKIDDGDHRTPAFLALNPHGRIPVITDDETGVVLFESAAILLYLAEKSGRLLPTDFKARWEAIQWLIFHASSRADPRRHRALPTSDRIRLCDARRSPGGPLLAGGRRLFHRRHRHLRLDPYRRRQRHRLLASRAPDALAPAGRRPPRRAARRRPA